MADNKTIQIQFRRGTTAQNDAFTGKEGSLTVDLTKKALRLHDGVTAGGFELPNTTAINTAISTAIATAIGGDNVVNSVAGRSGDVVLTHTDITDWDTAVGDELQAISDSLNDYVLKTQLGVATTTTGEPGEEVTTVGVATLDANGLIPTSQLPPLAITSVQTVADVTARDALTNVQEGDFVIVTNENESDGDGNPISAQTFIRSASGWVELTASNAVLSVNGYTGVVQLTKSDVGLGNVDNFATATSADLDPANPVTDKFTTPATVFAILEVAGIVFDEDADSFIIDQGSLDDADSSGE